MMPGRPASGMARLMVDGADVGSVYYELDDRPRDGAGERIGTLSGDPFALRRAFLERRACLVPERGRRLHIRVIDVAHARGTASIRLAEPASQKAP